MMQIYYHCSGRGWMRFVMLVSALTGLVLSAGANNIRVTNIALTRHDTDNKRVCVDFDLSWENSWRNELNHDAAWVFVKFRAPGSNKWEHSFLSTNSAAHTPAVDSEIIAVSDGTGVFVRRAGAYTGSVSYVRTRLLWDYGSNGYDFARGAVIDVTVHAIEMVYVAEGSFYVGSGGTESGSFTDGSWGSGATIPFPITNEAALMITNQPGFLWGMSSSGNNTIGDPGELPALFPKGYAAFYCMKYSITQGQYANFLNLLTETQAGTRFPNQYGNDRHVITGTWPNFTADEAPDRACNYISWMDGAAYAQWSGLRPMTELEYEKACRGPASPVANEYAWGTNTITQQTGHTGSDGSGTETASPAGANACCGGSANIQGPVRVGIFATNGANRVSAGATTGASWR